VQLLGWHLLLQRRLLWCRWLQQLRHSRVAGCQQVHQLCQLMLDRRLLQQWLPRGRRPCLTQRSSSLLHSRRRHCHIRHLHIAITVCTILVITTAIRDIYAS
jgi:hypothetical protein